MRLEGKARLSILEACDAACVSRAGFTGTLMSTRQGVGSCGKAGFAKS
jgi:hypothetical protein